jgi:hypothetical protein
MNCQVLPMLLCLSLPLAGYSQVVNGDFEVDRFGDPISGWTGTAQILGQPEGSPLIPPFNTPPPPISISGNCSAGIRSGATLRQSFVGEQGLGYSLSFSAKAMNQPTAGLLRVRVMTEGGNVLAQLDPVLQLGGAGSDGYSPFTLVVPPLAAAGPLAIEFANTRLASQDSTVSVDAVQLAATAPSAPPVLQVKGYVGSTFGSVVQLRWTEPAFGYVLQSSSRISGPWTNVPNVTLARKDGHLAADISGPAAAASVYFRLRASP